MTKGKSINLFLMDGDANGRVKCSLANWTGVAYKIPRTMIERAKGISYLHQTGVYFLFGVSEKTDRPVVYVGQAGIRKNGQGILCRLEEHKRDDNKDYWTEAVAFTTSNNSFGPTEISYLENRFCNMALDAERYEVKNSNDPTHGNITEEKESEMEEFIIYAKLVMGALGYKVFEPLVKKSGDENLCSKEVESEELILYLKRHSRKSNRNIEAKCKQTNEGFVVLKNSMIETIDSESIPSTIREKRKSVKIDENGYLLEDVLFKSPSYAAAFILGGHVNGLTEWKTKEGINLKEYEKNNM